MRQILFSLLLLICTTALLPTTGKAQIYDPVDWSFAAVPGKNGEVTLELTATIEAGWHVYSQDLPSDEGPIPTSFSFASSDKYSLRGKVAEEKYITHYDPNFMMDLNYFEDRATWRQRIDRKTDGKFTVSGMLTYMVCNEERCLPPDDIEFEIEVPAAKTEDAPASDSQSAQKTATGNLLGTAQSGGLSNQLVEPVTWMFDAWRTTGDTVEVHLKANIDAGWHLYGLEAASDLEGPLPTEIQVNAPENGRLAGEVQATKKPVTAFDNVFEMEVTYFEGSAEFVQKLVMPKKGSITGTVNYMACDDERCIFPDPVAIEVSVDTDGSGEDAAQAVADSRKDSENDQSLWGIFFVAFLGGFAALLTPCVFPMIPMTVSFFTKQSKSRAAGITNAIVYGISIIAIYVLLGFGVTKIFGSDALNAMSTNVVFNLAFFVLLVVFAISFFGAFEITLPSSWINKADRQADKGGMLGIFFMAFTLALVSFSCTGPIIGTLLVEAAYIGGTSGPLIGMFGFSLALAIPFALFAAFPGWLNSLPQSGGWLNSVKVVLGFLELGLAFKFLSNADLVMQWNLLPRELFIAIWIAVSAALALYLFGFIRMPHDSPSDKLGVGRLMLALVATVFTLYLIPGLWGAPLKIISGFPPPQFYSESPGGFGAPVAVSAASAEGQTAHTGGATCPHNLNCFHDYDEGLAEARRTNKPLMLDFTGWACVNCRKMEDKVWSDPRVLSILANDVVLVSLYVDDKRELPKEEQIEVEFLGKKRTLKTIGNKWSHLQTVRYLSNSQPQYILLDHNEQMLVEPEAYNPDTEEYLAWLERGLKAFENKTPLASQ